MIMIPISRHGLLLVLLMETIYILLLLWRLAIMKEEIHDMETDKIMKEVENGPKLYLITPTYYRTTQMADLTRLSQTLMHVKNLHWIVVEDAPEKSVEVRLLLKRCGIPFTHLNSVMPDEYKEKTMIGRGVWNRRAGLDWLRKNAKEGVLYFADDDNTYDLRIFEQIRYTKTVSVFPVGMILSLGISSPIVDNGRVTGFHDGFGGGRKFAVDMAGFAVNLWVVLSNPEATIPTRVSYLEDGFLRRLNVELQDLEPLANGCTEVLVWHTRTQRPGTPKFSNIKDFMNTNLAVLYKNIKALNL